MRIAFNAVAVQGGGGQTYLLKILEALCAAEPRHDYIVLLTSQQEGLARQLPRGARPLVCGDAPTQSWLRIVWEQAVLPGAVRRLRAELLFAAYNTAVLLSPVPVVLLVQNSNPFSRLPIGWSWYGRARHWGLRVLGRLSARVAQRSVFVSQSSARILAPRMGVSADRVRVVYHGWNAVQASEIRDLSVAERYPKRFILTVADLQPHKNLELLLHAFDDLVRRWEYSGALVLVGEAKAMSSKYAQKLLALRDRLACADRIVFTGTMPHEALASLYNRAELFCFPSLEETFGIPLVEAMGEGVPVVAADWRLAPSGEQDRFNVGPEICGDAAEFFDPTDVGSLVASMRRVLENPKRREELRHGGRLRASQFSWDRAARELLTVFEEAARPEKRVTA